MDWDDENTSCVEAAIKRGASCVRFAIHEDGTERDIYVVRMFKKEFGVVVNESKQAITILTMGMVANKVPAKVLKSLFDSQP